MEPENIKKWVDAEDYEKLLYKYQMLLRLFKDIQGIVDFGNATKVIEDATATSPKEMEAVR